MSYQFAEDVKLEPINLESLRQEKGFQKTAKKQQKELDAIKKRQLKEKQAIQKSQCLAVEKLVKSIKYVYIYFFFYCVNDQILLMFFSIIVNLI